MSSSEAAVAILHARASRSVLLMRRAERTGDPWSGHWSFPGGRRDPEDADLLQTALRELEEECGIQLGREHLERALTPSTARRRTRPFVLVAPFVFQVEQELPVVLDEREAVGSIWMPTGVLADPSRHCLRCVPGVPAETIFPCVPLDGAPLWGFTYRLVMEWLGVGAGEHNLEADGFAAAGRVLDFLLSRGLKLERSWSGEKDEGPVTNSAVVRGTIPVEDVRAFLSAPAERIPPMNAVEVRPDRITVTGLAFEQYEIRAEGE